MEVDNNMINSEIQPIQQQQQIVNIQFNQITDNYFLKFFIF